MLNFAKFDIQVMMSLVCVIIHKNQPTIQPSIRFDSIRAWSPNE